jgi:glycosyltransferase involved in cell wall biosynthesis
MKIMMVSTPFPPYNNIGGVRTGKMAKYLFRAGHDLRVITVRNQLKPVALPLEVPFACVTYAPWFNLAMEREPTARYGLHDAARDLARGLRPLDEAVVAYAARSLEHPDPTRHRGDVPGSPGVRSDPVGTGLAAQTTGSIADPDIGLPRRRPARPWRLLHALVGFPDPLVGWYPFARSVALRVGRNWRPDVILASSPGPTALMVANSVASRLRAPWVAEFRDLWMDHPALDWPAWRRSIGERLERRTLSTAAALVTVSKPWAESLRRKFGKPVAVVTNGFDPEDFPRTTEVPFREGTVRLVHTGTLDGASRDPSPLLAAISRMDTLTPKVRVAFYGPADTLVLAGELAKSHGVQANVELIPSVPYRESLRAQTEADVLLMLLWTDPNVRGWHSGKLFEYMGARRPVLAIGPAGDVGAELIQARRLGVVLSNPEQIARQLEEWIDVKSRVGGIPAPPAEAAVGFTREEQAAELGKVLLSAAATGFRSRSVDATPGDRALDGKAPKT